MSSAGAWNPFPKDMSITYPGHYAEVACVARTSFLFFLVRQQLAAAQITVNHCFTDPSLSALMQPPLLSQASSLNLGNLANCLKMAKNLGCAATDLSCIYNLCFVRISSAALTHNQQLHQHILSRYTTIYSAGIRFKVKAVSAEQGQLSRSKASLEVRTVNQQVAGWTVNSLSQVPAACSSVWRASRY